MSNLISADANVIMRFEILKKRLIIVRLNETFKSILPIEYYFLLKNNRKALSIKHQKKFFHLKFMTSYFFLQKRSKQHAL